MDNLRARLAAMDPDQEFMMGHKLTDDGVMLLATSHLASIYKIPLAQVSYYSGGSGYVLSRGAFTRLMREGLLLPGPRRCAMPHTRAEGISNYPPEWYSINEDVQVSIYV